MTLIHSLALGVLQGLRVFAVSTRATLPSHSTFSLRRTALAFDVFLHCYMLASFCTSLATRRPFKGMAHGICGADIEKAWVEYGWPSLRDLGDGL